VTKCGTLEGIHTNLREPKQNFQQTVHCKKTFQKFTVMIKGSQESSIIEVKKKAVNFQGKKYHHSSLKVNYSQFL
jgi:hypothetical protein